MNFDVRMSAKIIVAVIAIAVPRLAVAQQSAQPAKAISNNEGDRLGEIDSTEAIPLNLYVTSSNIQ